MRFTATVRLSADRTSDVLVDVEPETTIAALGEALGKAVGISHQGVWVHGARLEDSATVDQVHLGQGAVIALSPAPDLPRPATRGWRLHVVAGSQVGSSWDLTIGVHDVGRTSALRLDDTRTSRLHARIEVTGDGAVLSDRGSSNGTFLDGQRLDETPVPLVPGQLIAIGDSLLTVAVAREADAAVQPGPDGVVEFTRSPRIRPGRPPSRVAMPTPPEKAPRRKIPVVAMVVPLLMGGVMAFLFSPTFLLFTLMSPVMMMSNIVSERREAKKTGKVAGATYAEQLEIATASIAAGLESETQWRRAQTPDACQALLTATLPTRQLWERRRTDEDALVLRVGTTDLPSELTIASERPSSSEVPEHRTVFGVPVTLSLRDTGILGLAGEPERVRMLAYWLVTQLATFHAPRDVALTVLAPKGGAGWAWVRWLPHARPAELDSGAASVGTDTDTVTSRVVELGALLKHRKSVLEGSGRLDRAVFPAHVVVLDGARALRAVPGVAALLQDGPDVGIFALCLEDEERLLPEECKATVALDEHNPRLLAVHAMGRGALSAVHVELMRGQEAEQIARAMAPVRDISPDEGETTLPDSARLLDVLSLEPPTVDAIRTRWQLDGRTTTMALGVGQDGPFDLDLVRDGPHGLIAGTTGSGKSELLQTMIASLAAANRPDAMNFVLVDYKGGSAFKDCVRLPHTVGMVTDLDAHLVQRALTSLGAELKRREHQLADVAVKDIEDYQDLDNRTPGGIAPMPRLLLVIDEFASMARELPDFVTGLVNIAQRGRSLGIHLLLATQRPSGVVSPEIRANTNLRISLRVTDAADSMDVLDAKEAARIPKSAPGRGYARLGASSLVPFQSGRVGGRRPGLQNVAVRPPFVVELGWGQLGYAPPYPKAHLVKEDDALTDLGVLVDVIGEAAVAAGFPAQRSPWLEALPEAVLLSSLPVVPAQGTAIALPWGLEDLPEDQLQEVRTLDLARDGHLLVVGASRSGRSQLLRTLAGAATAYSPADLHLYGIDCGNGALAALKDLPHCGAVVNRTEVERASRLYARLLSESERRQALLSASGFADIGEQRAGSAPDERLPHIVVLIDRWEGFLATLAEVDGDAMLDATLGLLREGASVGIHVVIAGDRSLTSSRISSLTESKIVLRLADKGDAGMVGLHSRDVPDNMPPGRAVLVTSTHEVQTAILTADTSGQAQAAALTELGALARERFGEIPASQRPFRVDGLPSSFAIADALDLVAKKDTPGLFVPFGVGGDDLDVVGVDLAGTPAALVAGPAKSGRSTMLAFIAKALMAQGTAVVVAAPRLSPLRDLPGLHALLTDPAATLEEWEAALVHPGRLVVVVDDGEGLKDSPAGPLLAGIAKGLAGEGRGLVLGGNADGICTGFTGWQVEVKKSRQGALLSPQELGNGDLIGLRLPRSSVGGAVTAGRALVHTGNGSLTAVVVPQ